MESFEDTVIVAHSVAFLALIFSLLLYQFRSRLRTWWSYLRNPFLKHFFYRPIIHSRRLRVQWSRADVLAELTYIGLNVFWVWFKSPSLEAASRRAANLCLGNLVFLCATPHLDVLTNTLGLGCRSIRRFHGSVGIMATLLIAFHALSLLSSSTSFSIAENQNLWAVLVSCV